MECKIIKDIDFAKSIFTVASFVNDYNSKNYNEKQFDSSWKKWLNFYVLYDIDKVVAFCGIRKFDNNYARIFDRYFISPEYRNNSLSHKEYSVNMVKTLVDDCISKGYQPFFSIQTRRKRRSTDMAVKTFNKHIEQEFRVLDGLYCTVPNSKDNPDCWQNIATISPYEICLEKSDVF